MNAGPARERQRRPADRRARRVDGPRLPRRAASRSRSSTPASTRRTPTSAVPAPPPPTPRRRRRHRARRTRAVRPDRAEGEGRHRPRRRRLQRRRGSWRATSPTEPDPNPLDCNGHGSHVAGTAAGFGVIADGRTYTGPYNATTYTALVHDRTGRGAESRSVRRARVRLRGLDRRHRRRDRVGGRRTTWTSSTCRSARRSARRRRSVGRRRQRGQGRRDRRCRRRQSGRARTSPARPATSTRRRSVAANDAKPERPGR